MWPWLVPLVAVMVAGVALWLVSLVVRDASIADIFWGPLFIVIAGTSFALGDGSTNRRLLVLALASAWGVRLMAHIALRSVGRGEDHRYREMRERRGPSFWLTSLPLVFLLQPLLAWIVSLPLQAAMQQAKATPLGLLDLAGAALSVIGLSIEAVADRQLDRFKADPENRGRVLDRGLWRYSRHPNYFGESLVWWGFGLIGLSTGNPWFLVGPALMTFLLLRVSGVSLLEQTIEDRRPGYSEYKRTTSAFLPLPKFLRKVQSGVR